MANYTTKIDAVLALAAGWTEAEFAELAIAAADQAGMSAKDQAALRASLFKCPSCGDSAYGYEPLHEDVAPVNGQCENCHTYDVSAVLRGKRDAIEEGRGDYMRDQRKDCR